MKLSDFLSCRLNILPFRVVCSYCGDFPNEYSSVAEPIGSSQDPMSSLSSMPCSLTPGKGQTTRLLHYLSCSLPKLKICRPSHLCTSFEAQSHGLLSDCLRLNHKVTLTAPRLALVTWLESFQAGFPPTK